MSRHDDALARYDLERAQRIRRLVVTFCVAAAALLVLAMVKAVAQ